MDTHNMVDSLYQLKALNRDEVHSKHLDMCAQYHIPFLINWPLFPQLLHVRMHPQKSISVTQTYNTQQAPQTCDTRCQILRAAKVGKAKCVR